MKMVLRGRDEIRSKINIWELILELIALFNEQLESQSAASITVFSKKSFLS